MKVNQKYVFEIYNRGKLVDKGDAESLSKRWYCDSSSIRRCARLNQKLRWDYVVKRININDNQRSKTI